MGNYLKEYYLDDNKLRQRALLEFHRAMKTGRMIAFTGAMTTEAFGYGSWKELGGKIVQAAETTLSDAKTGNIASVVNMVSGLLESDKNKDNRVAFSILGEAIDQAYARSAVNSGGSGVKHFEEEIAKLFQGGGNKRIRRGNFHRDYNIARALVHEMGIQRFATLNYDLELEGETLFPGASMAAKSTKTVFRRLEEKKKDSRGDNFFWEPGSGRIRRVLTGGIAIESDVLDRERIDRMIEFAVGTDDVDSHIIHLHGRADIPKSMAVSYRDYDKLYRRNDLHKAPFEFAKRILIGGNPILFIGLGMDEAEVNRELEDFISNRPYNRVAPTFLLWNALSIGMTDEEMKMKRLDMLHRLGVFIIYDRDLNGINFAERPSLPGGTSLDDDDWGAIRKEFEKDHKTSDDKLDTLRESAKKIIENKVSSLADWRKKRSDLSNLRKFFPVLLENATATAKREETIGDKWRTMASRVKAEGDSYASIWEAEPPSRTDLTVRTKAVLPQIIETLAKHDMVCIIGPSGSGKGELARAVADSATLDSIPKNNRMLINGGFSFDTDSMLDGVARFLSDGRRGTETAFEMENRAQNAGRAKNSRSRFFAADDIIRANKCTGCQPDTLIIINGMDRFFGIRGQPLSAELEELLRFASSAVQLFKRTRVKWLLFGTERVRTFMRDQLKAKVLDLAELDTAWPKTSNVIGNVQMDVVGKRIKALTKTKFKAVARARWDEYEAARHSHAALSAGKISGDIQEERRTFYNLALSSEVLSHNKMFGRESKIALTILRTLAFIGLPVEAQVLMHCPALASMKLKDGMGNPIFVELPKLKELLTKLSEIGLVTKMTGFKDYKNHGTETPETRFVLHRSLLAEMRYRFGIPLSEAKLSTAFNMSLYVAQPVDGSIPEPEIHDELGALVDRLIGAYRDKQSTEPSLQYIASTHSFPEGELEDALQNAADACAACKDDECGSGDAPLVRMHQLCRPEYIQCLRAALSVVRCYYSTASILALDTNDRLIREDRDGILLEHAERLDRLIDAYGKITLARESMREKLQDVFPRIYGEAEPFYADEMVWLHNERGVVKLTMGDLYEARSSFERALNINRQYVELDDRAHNWRRIRLNQLTVDTERGDLGLAERKIGEIIDVTEQRIRVSGFELDEDKLAIAIATGYRGWCWHLRGQRHKALVDYDVAISAFEKLSEARAQAYFARLRVNVRDPDADPGKRIDEVRRALDYATSTRQMDLVYRIRVFMADELMFGRNAELGDRRLEANRILDDAIRYSLQTDTHRVRCEAALSIARVRFQSGDYEGAFRNAADALTVATRYGLELRKITIRAVIAQIMAKRGHPVTAEHLIRTSIKAASRIGFETAIDLAERVARTIPQVSSITGTIDMASRK